MIRWSFHVSRFNSSTTYTPKDDQIIQLNETDEIEFEVSMPPDYREHGEPYLVIGDVPLELEPKLITDTSRIFTSLIATTNHKNQHFYNYFGESEVLLRFKDTNTVSHGVKVDIKARPANASLAASMLKYISENMSDMLALCFSKSSVGGQLHDDYKSSIHKLSLLQSIMAFMIKNKGSFIREYKFDWQHDIEITENGTPTGPDSIYWLLHNLDNIQPSDKVGANLKINSRLYTTEKSPREFLSENADIYENRVIYSFLYAAKMFVSQLIAKCGNDISDKKNIFLVTDKTENYISFEHALKSYQRFASFEQTSR
jgi:hypothetical protein